ncbi:hypothetical protein N658DRAFT_425461 [Parathielavia hyrcaniae]|uniref:Glutamyl-tRNA amidotransferase complex subunit Gta3 domain-containing protein n=1 Tax=Parathielavia hyrcaniae TaxID=113614 RepID=A0AAN6Q5V3_9PEZI|nr:hypothetical protein N658DRAFT_425461 [Parathielavia hyrcaniae]
MANSRLPLSHLSRRIRLNPTRHASTASSHGPPPPSPRPQHDPYALLSTPTWSIRTLLPTSPSQSNSNSNPNPTQTTPTTQAVEEEAEPTTPKITPQTLSHLLRLSALPEPSHPAESAALLRTLHAQLHFVRDIQRVDTAGVEPLSSIRDETPEGLREATVTLTTLRHALAEEEVYGRCRRPRRKRRGGMETGKVEEGVEDWDVLGCAAETVGRYFVVRSGPGTGNKT